MKKLIAVLAALTMLFVCGCGSNSKDNGTDNGNGTNNGTNNAVDERHDTNTNTVGDDVREGVDDAGNAVGDAVDDVGNAIRDGADAVTGDNNNAAKQPNTVNGTNAPAGESVKQKRHGVSCAVFFVFLHRFTGAHELRQQYALSGRQIFAEPQREVALCGARETAAPAAGAKRKGHLRFPFLFELLPFP